MRTDLCSHFAFGVFDSDGPAIRREKKGALQGCHNVCSAPHVLVFHEGDWGSTFGVHAQAAEAREAVHKNTTQVLLSGVCT